MITITYKQLSDPGMTMTLDLLANSRGLPIKVAYRLGKIKQKLDKEMTLARNLFRQVYEEFAELGDQGQFKMDSEGNPEKLKSGKTQEAWKTRQTELMLQQIELPYDPISIDDLKDVKFGPDKRGLTPNEILALEPFLEPMEEDEKTELAS